MGVEKRHIPPQGQNLIPKHTATPDCICRPKASAVYKLGASGRGGSHQGRKLVRWEYRHNLITDATKA